MSGLDCIPARDLGECLGALEKYAGEAALVAGGTDLHIVMRARLRTPRVLIYVGNLPELKYAREDKGEISFGPTLTHTEIAGDGILSQVRSLQRAASSIGSPQIRNVGTAGGNLANASPAGDLYPPLLTLDAKVVVQGIGGKREVGLEDLVKSPGVTTIAPTEIIGGIHFQAPPAEFHSNFLKIGLRNALAISVANAAIMAASRDGKFEDVRIACGAVAPRAMRMRKTEALLAGEQPTAELVREAGEIASKECDPITDIRATKTYRRHVVGVIVTRLVEEAWHQLVA